MKNKSFFIFSSSIICINLAYLLMVSHAQLHTKSTCFVYQNVLEFCTANVKWCKDNFLQLAMCSRSYALNVFVYKEMYFLLRYITYRNCHWWWWNRFRRFEHKKNWNCIWCLTCEDIKRFWLSTLFTFFKVCQNI